MQEQQGTIGSFSGSLDLNHGSASITAVDQQICWNNVQNAAEDDLADYIVAPDDIGITYNYPLGQERQNPRRWCFGEPGSSSVHNQANLDEQRREHRCSSSVASCTSNGPSLDEQFYEQTNTLPFNGVNRHPVIIRRSNRDAATPSINLNEEYVIPGANNCPPNLCKSSETGNEQMQAGGGNDLSSGSGGHLVEENGDRISRPAEGRHASRKRKSPEVTVGQSSASGSCSYVQPAETSGWSAVPPNYNAPPEHLNPGINVCPRGIAFDTSQDLDVAGNIESSHRNVRVRIHPSSQADTAPQPLFPTASAVRPYGFSSSQQSPRPFSLNNSLDSRSASMAGRTTAQNPPAFHVPALPRNLQPFSSGGASVSRPGSSSGSVVSGNIDAPHERTSSRSMGRNIREHLRVSASTDLMRNMVPNPTNRSLVSGNERSPGNVASAQAGSSSVVPSSAPSGAYHVGPPSRYPRRLTEYVRRSLFSSAGSDSGGQSSNSSLHSGPSSQEMLLASATGNQDHLQSNSRLASWMERQGDRVLSIPLRNLPISREGRRGRLVSEIRSVLDLMRRGEGFRFEDVMILDPSGLFGVADIHDRHRDMRLDVDNMSYEELLALEERIGNVCTGLSEETILSKLKQHKYSNLPDGQEEEEPCCICQEEYNNEEDIGKLDCGHEFHRDCIKQWLAHKNLCPICKTTGLAT